MAKKRKQKRKCCRTCHFSDWERKSNGGINPNRAGACLYPIIMPQLPAAVLPLSVYKPRTGGIRPDDGKDCACYATEKEYKRQQKLERRVADFRESLTAED